MHPLHNSVSAGIRMARSKWLTLASHLLTATPFQAQLHLFPGSEFWGLFAVMVLTAESLAAVGESGCVLGCHGRAREARERHSGPPCTYPVEACMKKRKD